MDVGQVRTKEGKSKKVAALAVALVASFTLLFGLIGCACAPEEAPVPDVVGMTKADAEKVIKDNKFEVGAITEEFNKVVPVGDVVSQDPASGKEAQLGSKVNLVISKGSDEKVKAPDLNGMTQTEAEAALLKVGLVPYATDPAESDTAPGKVFKQSVQAGSEVQVGTTVTFTIAIGNATTAVPDVVGQGEGAAIDVLHKASFAADVVREYSDDAAEGVVLRQNPLAGTQITNGSRVVLAISLGKAPAEKIAVPNLMTFTLEEAEKFAESAGLKIKSSGDADGVVVSQKPAAGEFVDRGAAITVKLYKE